MPIFALLTLLSSALLPTTQEPAYPARPRIAVASSGAVVALRQHGLTLVYQNHNKLPRALEGGNGAIDFTFTPDDQEVVASMSGGGVAVWNVASGTQVARLRHAATPGVSLALSSDGSVAAVGSSERKIELFDLKHQTWLLDTKREQETKEVFAGSIQRDQGRLVYPSTSDYTVNGLAMSPDGRLLAAYGDNGSHFLRLWQVSTGNLVHEVRVGTEPRLAWSPDNVSVLDLNGVRGWEVATGEGALFNNGTSNVFGRPPVFLAAIIVTPAAQVMFIDSQTGTVSSCAIGEPHFRVGPHLDTWPSTFSRTDLSALDRTGRFAANFRTMTDRITIWSTSDGHVVWTGP